MQLEGLFQVFTVRNFFSRTSTSSRLHRYFIMLILGDWGGVESLRGPLYSKNSQVHSTVCFGLLSCWKWKRSCKPNLRALVFKLASKIFMYIIAVICPLMNTRFPPPLAAMQPYTSTLPSPNFTVGSKFFERNAQVFSPDIVASIRSK